MFHPELVVLILSSVTLDWCRTFWLVARSIARINLYLV